MNLMRIQSFRQVVGMSFLLLAFCCTSETKKEATTDQIPQVGLATIKSLQPSLVVSLPGELKPWNKTNLFPKVKGYIRSVAADRGTPVKKGQVLAVLEAPELIA